MTVFPLESLVITKYNSRMSVFNLHKGIHSEHYLSDVCTFHDTQRSYKLEALKTLFILWIRSFADF